MSEVTIQNPNFNGVVGQELSLTCDLETLITDGLTTPGLDIDDLDVPAWPPGVIYDGVTNTISGTPTEAGTFVMEFYGSADGSLDAETVYVTVTAYIQDAVSAGNAAVVSFGTLLYGLSEIVTSLGTTDLGTSVQGETLLDLSQAGNVFFGLAGLPYMLAAIGDQLLLSIKDGSSLQDVKASDDSSVDFTAISSSITAAERNTFFGYENVGDTEWEYYTLIKTGVC